MLTVNKLYVTRLSYSLQCRGEGTGKRGDDRDEEGKEGKTGEGRGFVPRSQILEASAVTDMR